MNELKKKDLFSVFEERGIKFSPIQNEQLISRLSEILTYEPRIGVFGKTGAGKSSLCNAIFGQHICEIGDILACTRNPQDVLLNMGGNGIKLIDVPGVGESTERDEEYAKLYSKLLPELDVVLWLIRADDRALATDERFYRDIVKPHIDQNKPFFFVISQVRKINPDKEWNEETNEPGPTQSANVEQKIKAVTEQFDIPAYKVIAISADEKYNITALVDEFVRALPKEKKITAFKAVNQEFQSAETGEDVKRSFLDVVLDAAGKVVDKVEDIIFDVKYSPLGDFIGSCMRSAGTVMDFLRRFLPF